MARINLGGGGGGGEGKLFGGEGAGLPPLPTPMLYQFPII